MLDVPGPLSLVCDLPTGTLVQLISGILEDTANLCSRDVRGTSTRFHSTQLLPISVQDYLDRCVKWLPVQKDALLLVLVYLRHTRPIFNRWTIHRLLLAALSIASKFISDFTFSQKRLSRVAGASEAEALQLEIELLVQLEFHLGYTTEQTSLCASAILAKQSNTFDASAFISAAAPPSQPGEDDDFTLSHLALSNIDVSPQVISPGLGNSGFDMGALRPGSPSTESTASTDTIGPLKRDLLNG